MTNKNHATTPNTDNSAPPLKAREVSDKFTDEERKNFAQEVKERFCSAFEKLAKE